MNLMSWDENKNTINRAKHGVDFRTVRDFDWDMALMRMSPSSNRANEPRLFALGPVGRRLYALVYSIESGAVRVISFRKANRKEIRNYEQEIATRLAE